MKVGQGLAAFLTVLLILQGSLVDAGAGGGPGKDMGGMSKRVLWRVERYVMGKDASWGKEEARGLVFTPLEISWDRISFDDRVCTPVHFREEKVTTREFLAGEWRVTPEELGIDDPRVTVVTTDCGIPGFDSYLHL